MAGIITVDPVIQAWLTKWTSKLWPWEVNHLNFLMNRFWKDRKGLLQAKSKKDVKKGFVLNAMKNLSRAISARSCFGLKQ